MSYPKITNSTEHKYFQTQSDVKYQFSDFILCTKQNILIQGDQVKPLNLKAFQCLYLLVTHPNKIVSRELFFNHVWNGCVVGDGVLNVNISCLRKILGKNRIRTFTGRGYTLIEQVNIIEDNSHSDDASPIHKTTNPIQKPNNSFFNRIKTVFTSTF